MHRTALLSARSLLTVLALAGASACSKPESAPAAAPTEAAAPAAEAAKPAGGRPPPASPEEINNKELKPAAPAAAATETGAATGATPGAPAAPAAPAPVADGQEHPAMKNPALATLKAPEKFSVRFKTTKGDITLQITRAWSPLGADRFFNLVKIGYFKDIAFFRAVPNFMAQFGIHGDPAVNNVWRDASIPDDPPAGQSNKKYFLTFAKKGMPNSRSVQFFINFKDNAMLDGMGFTPIGEVIEGKENFDKINTQYGEGAPRGMGPDQMRVQTEGNAYLKKDFPALDYILSAEVL